jgi:adenylate kinase family enzyme
MERILELPAWIVDCWYRGWTDQLLQAASVIVWLDLPWLVAAWRIVKRHILADRAGYIPHPGLRRLVAFLRSERRRFTDAPRRLRPLDDGAATWASIANAVGRNQSKLIHYRRSTEVHSLLRRVREGGGTVARSILRRELALTDPTAR